MRIRLALPPRDLMRWALNNLHPIALANIVNIPFSHNSQANRLFWRVDSNTLLGRFYLMHMLCVRPEIDRFRHRILLRLFILCPRCARLQMSRLLPIPMSIS